MITKNKRVSRAIIKNTKKIKHIKVRPLYINMLFSF